MAKPHKFQKNRMPFLLLSAVQAGAEKTIKGWADQFKCSREELQGALGTLRKEGYLLHPVGVDRIVTDVTERQEDLVETMERHRKNLLDPQLVAFSRFVEQGIARFPVLLPVFRQYLNSEMAHLTVVEEELKLHHGNPQRQNRPYKAG